MTTITSDMTARRDEVLARLEALGEDKVRAQNTKRGAGDNQFGVKLGAIRALAKELGRDHELGLALWETGNVEARLLAILLWRRRALTADQLDDLVRTITFAQVADWFIAYVLAKHREAPALRERWLDDPDPWAARAGWQLTAKAVAADADGVDLGGLLDRLESEMAAAPPEAQWTMNTCLAEIGINSAAHRERALAIGETLGLYRDYPVSKGCTSPFAPIWISEMVARAG